MHHFPDPHLYETLPGIGLTIQCGKDQSLTFKMLRIHSQTLRMFASKSTIIIATCVGASTLACSTHRSAPHTGFLTAMEKITGVF